eukprot:TRINITY_DN9402_c0_g1_i1.p1 TRINITY_DN9402_c0_g1~~TRINITY_DN9402_c0_g1_i1.p1  ORF type:complete len:578 (-),score=12.30 TRINITY_DN9402_c0_g1_i1:192-1925(-)
MVTQFQFQSTRVLSVLIRGVHSSALNCQLPAQLEVRTKVENALIDLQQNKHSVYSLPVRNALTTLNAAKEQLEADYVLQLVQVSRQLRIRRMDSLVDYLLLKYCKAYTVLQVCSILESYLSIQNVNHMPGLTLMREEFAAKAHGFLLSPTENATISQLSAICKVLSSLPNCQEKDKLMAQIDQISARNFRLENNLQLEDVTVILSGVCGSNMEALEAFAFRYLSQGKNGDLNSQINLKQLQLLLNILVKSKYKSQFLLDSLAGPCSNILPQLDGPDIVQGLQQLRRLSIKLTPQSYALIAQQCIQQAKQLNTNQTVKLLDSFVQARFFHEQLFDILQRKLVKSIPNINIYLQVWILYSMACMTLSNDELVQLILKEQLKNLPNLDAGQVCQICWSLSVLQVWDDSWWNKQLSDKLNGCRLQSFSEVSLMQLFQCHLVTPSKVWWDNLNTEIKHMCSKTNRLRRRSYEVSLLQNQVEEALQLLGFETQLEYQLPNVGIYVDILVILKSGKKIIVEVDGPYHYTLNQPYRALGATVLRNQILSQLGYQVIALPYYLIHSMGQEELNVYLCNLLSISNIQ